MRITDVIGGKPIAACLWSVLGVSAINRFVTFYDIKAGKFLFLSPQHHIGPKNTYIHHHHHQHRPINLPTAEALTFLMDHT
jgi:hypothetical protein